MLALQLIALGADLVADDQTQLSLQAGRLIGTAPLALAGLIEARGIGILRIGFLPGAPVHLVVDMDQRETSRLPTPRTIEFLGIACDLVFGSQSNHFPGALMCYLRGERHA